MNVSDDWPYFPQEAKHGSWEVRDHLQAVLDSIPTQIAAENVARELNRAYERGKSDAQDEMRKALGM